MNRQENIVCKGCGKVSFKGRCYRCLSCQDFNMCAECYDNDFTSAEHPFDHPVKCVFTPADVELYFGGEYLNDPPQSYRCPYCKLWGFNESTFLEHVSSEHVGASTLLVSTMVTLFEQQQAVRLFLEDEQLAVFTAVATSRNEQMTRNEGSLDLYLEPLNPNGSYRREHSFTPLTHRLAKSAAGAVSLAPWLAADAPASRQSAENNYLEPESGRRQMLDRQRLRFAQQQAQAQQQHHHRHHHHHHHHRHQQQQQQQQQQISGALTEMLRYNEPMPATPRTSRTANFRVVGSQAPIQSSNGRNVNFFSPTVAADMRRSFLQPASDIIRARTQRHRAPRLDSFPIGSMRQVQMHVQRGTPNVAPSPAASASAAVAAAQRLVEFSELAHGANELLSQNPATGGFVFQTIEEEEPLQLPEQKQSAQERERFLCFPFLSPSNSGASESEEQNNFLAHRAEFVAQLLASVLCEEDLAPATAATVRSSGDLAGAGDSQLELKSPAL